MPTYPSLQQQKPQDPIDLTKIQYPVSEWISAGAGNEFEHMVYLNTVNNTPTHIKPRENYPGSFPVTEEDIANWKVDRPELPNIPVGVPKYLAHAVVSKYDNDRNLALMSEADGNYIGKMAAWGSAVATSFLDAKAMLVALLSGGVGGAASETIGKWGLTRLGASEIFGSKAANIGTQIAQNGIKFGAGNVGFEASRQVQEQQAKTILQQPHEYLQSLQNIGIAGATGFLLGSVGSALGISLVGRRVMRFEDGSYVEMPPEGKTGIYQEPAIADFEISPDGTAIPKGGTTPEGKPWVASREGGLFNRTEFKEYTPQQKAHIADNFKPWTPESDITMTEEAAGQMMNGQTVKVDPIMKQGVADAGETFRQAMRDGNIDAEMFADVLDEAHENVKTELAETIRQSEELRKSTKAFEATERLPIEDGDISQGGILKRAELAQFEESIMRQSPELMPENVRKHIEIKKEIQRLEDKIEQDKQKQLEAQPEKTAADVEANKKVVKRIEALKKRLPKMLKPKAELKKLRRQLLDQVGTSEYGQGEPYQRLSELAKVWKSAKQLKDNLDLHHQLEGNISNLASHDFIINAMKDHINDTHEGATHADMRTYADQLRSTGIPEEVNAAAEFEPKPEQDIDAYIQEYSPEEVKSLAETIGDEGYTAEVENAYRKFEMIPKMREMVKNMTDCLMKGAV